MEYTRKLIASDPSCHQVFQRIMQKNQQHWRRFDGSLDVLRWLRNFSSEREIYLALILADGIMYYSLDEVRYLWRLILTNRVKQWLLRETFANGSLPKIDEWFEQYLRGKCLFLGYGPASKSGQSQVYYFKQSHSIEKLQYLEFHELLHGTNNLNEIERVFLLDDMVGSGDQAKTTWNKKFGGRSLDDVQQENPHLKFIYLALVGFGDGKKDTEKTTPMKVILGEELDERFKCFSDTSMIYMDESERGEARTVMEEKGKMLYDYPMGYADMQLAVAFCHNTPNNSLPVIWKRLADGGWWPLFERFE